MKKFIIIWFIMGMAYFTFEGFIRGWTNISMLFVGGLCGGLIGLLDEFPKVYKFKIWQQCILGTMIILIIEFISGLILNMWFKLNIWDYSQRWGDFKGQICIPFAIVWFLLTPIAIYLDDWIRWKFFGEEKPIYNVKEIYINLVKLK
ncbi:Putative ABC-transporter type IV [Clostridium sp. USBA 49]|uniref:putative ABC transporter permease n=1 Tax=Clostridium TaxID=1485 RepID=UPI0009C988A0|nr:MULTISPECIES: putative ABC transporter permease [Clostridium]SKA86369.1 Putative ABC-transporter type IV [Clostridium sp. USBA 49]